MIFVKKRRIQVSELFGFLVGSFGIFVSNLRRNLCSTFGLQLGYFRGSVPLPDIAAQLLIPCVRSINKGQIDNWTGFSFGRVIPLVVFISLATTRNQP